MSNRIFVLKMWKEVKIYEKWRHICHPALTCTVLLQRRQESTVGFSPVTVAQTCLEVIHDSCYLPWWGTIILACVSLRSAITLPLAVHQNTLITKIELLQPTLKELSEALKHRVTIEGRQKGWSSQAADKHYKKQLRKFTYNLYSSHGCNPIKLYTLPWAQIPLWIVISLALRDLSGSLRWDKQGTSAPHSGMATEGTLWFPDLTLPDPTGVLPVSLGILNLANIELHALKRKAPSTKQRVITMMFRTMSVCMIMIAYNVPAAMSLYWAVSAGFGLVQNILLKLPRVRRALRIKKTPSESATPFREMASIISNRATNFMKIQREDFRKK